MEGSYGKSGHSRFIGSFQSGIADRDAGVKREIFMSDISRPGIELTGYFKYYPKHRLQLLGKTELSFLEELTSEQKRESVSRRYALTLRRV